MKKIYSFILTALLLLGTSNAWGGNYLSGDMNSFAKSSGTEFVNGKATVTLAAYTTYNFEVYDNSYGEKYWSNSAAGTITSTTTYGDGNNGTYNKQLYENGGRSHITTTIAGDYTFNLTWDGSIPYLTVTYPTGTTYTVGFTNPKGWETVKAYVWNNSDGDKRLTNGFPGDAATGSDGYYEFTFTSGLAPSKIIWSNGDVNASSEGENPTKTGDLSWTNNEAVYNMSGKVDAFSRGTTSAEHYATFYDKKLKVQVPEGVTAYSGVISGDNSVLKLSGTSGPFVLPANTPVILKSSTSSISLTPTAATAESFSGGSLQGTMSETLTPAAAAGSGNVVCVLNEVNGHAGFYNYTGTYLNSGKAYIVVPAPAEGAPSIRFVIENENNTTGIEEIETSDKAVKFFENGQLFIQRDGVVYDMTGRAVK